MTGPTPGEIRRNEHLYARLKRLLTFSEKAGLFARSRDSYEAYEAELIRLAGVYGKRVMRPKDLVGKD